MQRYIFFLSTFSLSLVAAGPDKKPINPNSIGITATTTVVAATTAVALSKIVNSKDKYKIKDDKSKE